ncbi:MAG: DUF6869 domain-containing protein [Candidatus Berkiella sp.]
MNNSSEDIKNLLDSYLKYLQTHDDSYYWASDKLDSLISNPNGLQIVFELIEACENDMQIAQIAAGPLEDLINRNLYSIEAELTALVRKHQKMRKAICGVWAQDGSEARKIIDNILQQFGLNYSSL